MIVEDVFDVLGGYADDLFHAADLAASELAATEAASDHLHEARQATRHLEERKKAETNLAASER